MTRRPLAALGALAAGVVMLAGCAGGSEPDAGPAGSSSTAATTTAPSRSFPTGAVELCTAFASAYDAVLATDEGLTIAGSEPVPGEVLAALRRSGRAIADADLPSEVTTDQRDGIGIISQQLRTIAVEATGSDLDTLDQQLSDGERLLVALATAYVEETCDLDF